MMDRFLVFAQFGLIALMLFFSKGLTAFKHPTLPLLLFLIGLSVGLWALMHNRVGNFHIRPKMKSGSLLITTGIYGYIRHPMYSAVVVMMLAVLVADPSLVQFLFFVLLIVVLVLKANKEESLWMGHNEMQEAYETYKKQSKLFIPYIL